MQNVLTMIDFIKINVNLNHLTLPRNIYAICSFSVIF